MDVWNVPRVANGSDHEDAEGNMKFYACNYPNDPEADYCAPLYNESFLVGWYDGEIQVYGDMIDEDFNRNFIALDSLLVEEVGYPEYGEGYYLASSFWASPDSCVQGTIQFAIPGNQDTSVIFEQIVLWSECGDLNDFVLGEGIDWNIGGDSMRDEAVINNSNDMVIQRAFVNPSYDSCAGGMYVYSGADDYLGAVILDNENWIYPEGGGYNPDSIYDKLTSIDGTFTSENDTNGDLSSLYRLWEGDLSGGTTLHIITIKSVCCDGMQGLIDLVVNKVSQFIEENNPLFIPLDSGMCGDVNGDQSADVQDAIALANYFIEGDSVSGYLWNGEVNCDMYINYGDCISLLYFSFGGGPAPCDCTTADSSDPGIPDTMEILDEVVVPYTSESVQFGVPVRLKSDQEIGGIQLGFYHNSDDIVIDSATVYNKIVQNEKMIALLDYWIVNPLPPADTILATLWFTLKAGAEPQIITIDSGYFEPDGYFHLYNSFDSYGYHTPVIIPGTITVARYLVCGDVNQDWSADISDAVYIINYAFGGGPSPEPLYAGDVNCDGVVDISDATYLINFAFGGGNPPCDTNDDGQPDC